MTEASIYALAGWAIKTLLAMMFLTWVVEIVAFRRLRPALRASCTVGLAWVIAGVAAGLWETRGHGVDMHPSLAYLPAAGVVWLFYWRSLAKAYRDEE